MIGAQSFGSYKAVDVAIAASAATSTYVDLGQHINAFAIEMPSEWTAASISFLGARTADGTYKNIVGDTGTEISVTAGTGNMIALDSTKREALKPFRFIKVRSGTAASPVIQASARTLYILVK